MKRAAGFLTLLLLTAPLLANTTQASQEPATPQEAATPLILDRAHADSLEAGEVDVYALDLEAERFVAGVVDQVSVDVAVTVRGPDGDVVRRFDGPARGPERFQFDASAAGPYRLEVQAAQEGGEGRYSIVVRRVEPIATEPADRVDQLMTAFSGDDVPGGVVAVVREGRLVFAEAYGLANLTHGVPFTTETPTNIGSTSKQFTAFAIALLAERGELSLDDDIREHIPELPDFGDTVTLRHLLTHTSGYREFLNTLALTGRRLDEGDHIARSEILEVVRRQPGLQNAPGAEWNYNNSGFALLTLVVERVTGTPFPEWMEENVFGPLGMESTVVRADPSRIVRGSAQGYLPDEEDGWREAGDLGGAMGAGGIYTTAGDLAEWIRNFETGEVGGPDLFRRMTTLAVLTDGEPTEYGLGLFVDEWRGLVRVHHGGADTAHRSMLRYFPEIDAGVIALSNNATFPSGPMADDVAAAFFTEDLAPEEGPGGAATDFDPASYDPEEFDRLAGRYALDEAPTFILTFTREGDRFFLQATGQPRLEIFPTAVSGSEATFELRVVEASVTFHLTPDGTADSLTLHQNGDHLARRVGEVWEPSAEELEAYAGRYFSPELETFYTIAVEEGGLVLRHRRLEEGVKLAPGRERDTFTGLIIAPAELTFRRNEAGAVVGLEVSNVRTRGVRFERMGADSDPAEVNVEPVSHSYRGRRHRASGDVAVQLTLCRPGC